MVFMRKDGDFPASYVSLPEGTCRFDDAVIIYQLIRDYTIYT